MQHIKQDYITFPSATDTLQLLLYYGEVFFPLQYGGFSPTNSFMAFVIWGIKIKGPKPGQQDL